MSLPGFNSGRSNPPLARATGRALDERLVKGCDLIIAGLRKEGLDPAAALWILNDNIGEWRLWLVMPQIASKGPRRLMQETDAIIERLNGQTNIDAFDVDIVNPSDPEVASIAASAMIQGVVMNWSAGRNRTGDMITGDMYINYLDTTKILTEDPSVPSPG